MITNLVLVLRRISAALFILLAFSYEAMALPTLQAGEQLRRALDAVVRQDFTQARAIATAMSDVVARDIVKWSLLRKEQGKWLNYIDFLNDRSDWPGLKLLRKQGERVIPISAQPAKISAYFANKTPQTGVGALRLANALIANGDRKAALTIIRQAWRDLSLNGSEHKVILQNFSDQLTNVHRNRLENLLWRGWTSQAIRMLNLVSSEVRDQAKVRIALRRVDRNVDALLKALPTALQAESGVWYERFQWRIKKGLWDDAEALLAKLSASKQPLARPEFWSQRRRGFARRAMHQGNYNRAYTIAHAHGLSQGADYADLEWLAGYISLRFLQKPAQALQHFNRFQAAVKTPISLGRAGYWRGRAAEALADKQTARKSYMLAAQYQTSFYGQLAAEKLALKLDKTLVGNEVVRGWRSANFAQSTVLYAGILLHYADKVQLMRQFFVHLSESLDSTDKASLADLALSLERPYVAIGVAKQAAREGYILSRSYFPLTDLATFPSNLDAEIVLAIARRESELNPNAISGAGAQGLMQVMPRTAQQVAKKLNTPYSKSKLTADWKYNAKIGTAYLDSMLKRFNGSYVLGFAAYNAGPNRIDQWIKTYGDPRSPKVNVIDWIEHIPFRETRNYVMRVLESLYVYRARLGVPRETVMLSSQFLRNRALKR